MPTAACEYIYYYYNETSGESRSGSQVGLKMTWVPWDRVGASGAGFSYGKEGNQCAFLSACPGMGQKEKQKMGFESCQYKYKRSKALYYTRELIIFPIINFKLVLKAFLSKLYVLC